MTSRHGVLSKSATVPVAVRVAQENFRANGCAREVHLAKGSLPHRLAKQKAFDLALANINAHIIKEAVPHLASAMRPKGVLIASGILEGQAADVGSALDECGFKIERTLQIDDWAALVVRR